MTYSPGFIFGAGTDIPTPDELKRRRAIAQALAGQASNFGPADLGEGMSRLGAGIMSMVLGRSAAAGEARGKASASSGFKTVMGKLIGGSESQPFSSKSVKSSPVNVSRDPNLTTRIATDLVRDFGLTKEQAAGVVGNLSHETGGFKHMQELNPIVKGSRGGYGWAQWTGPRRRAFERFAAQNGLDPNSYEANYGFLKHELTNTPEGRVLGSLKGAADAESAAQIFSKQFLRPGVPHMESRVSRANQIASLLGNIPGSQSNPRIYPDAMQPQSGMTMQAVAEPPQIQQPQVEPVNDMPINPIAQALMGGPRRKYLSDFRDPYAEKGSSGGAIQDALMRKVAYEKSGGSMQGASMGSPMPQSAPDPNNPAYQQQMGPMAAQAANMNPEQMQQQAMQEAGALPIGELMDLMGNPYLNEAQQGILEMVFKQKLDAMKPVDPAKALELEKLKLELDQMRNPKRNTTTVDGNLVDTQTGEVVFTAPQKPGDPLDQKKKELELKKLEAEATKAGQPEVPGFKDVSGLRKEIQDTPQMKNYAQAAPIYRSMVQTAGRDSRASDLNLVYGLGKIMDPTSVVREGEMVMVKDTASLPDWLLGAINGLNGGQRLLPETRKAILAEAKSRMDAYSAEVSALKTQYEGLATRNRINMDDIWPPMEKLPDFTPEAPATGKASGYSREQIDSAKRAFSVATDDEAAAILMQRGIKPAGSQELEDALKTYGD